MHNTWNHFILYLLTCTCIGFPPGRVELGFSLVGLNWLPPWSGWTGFLPGRVELASSLVGLNWLPPEQCSLKKILWDLIEGRVSSPTRENALFAADFPQTYWQSDSRPPVTGTDTSWIFLKSNPSSTWQGSGNGQCQNYAVGKFGSW